MKFLFLIQISADFLNELYIKGGDNPILKIKNKKKKKGKKEKRRKGEEGRMNREKEAHRRRRISMCLHKHDLQSKNVQFSEFLHFQLSNFI
jgi:hypothetical protein